ncbi:HAD family hydrolase [Facklamia sp. P12934]|uniref:HAD family hydrolase n=1 Tax=Facklamia sp. P12934 TaxID=3421948 RepID=UPI003D16CAA8
MSIRAIGFDLDDTLYNRKNIYKKVFDVMEASVINTEIKFENFFDEFQGFSDIEYGKFMQRIKNKKDYKNDRVIKSYNFFGKKLSKKEAAIFNSLYLYFLNSIEYREGTELLLKYLIKNGYDLFILTNGSSGDQRKKLKYLGIENYIPSNKWFISDELNCTKPDRKIYKYVEQSLGYKGKEILYIGDDIENDIVGAQSSNWETILLNIHKLSDFPVDTARINNLCQIIDFLN